MSKIFVALFCFGLAVNSSFAFSQENISNPAQAPSADKTAEQGSRVARPSSDLSNKDVSRQSREGSDDAKNSKKEEKMAERKKEYEALKEIIKNSTQEQKQMLLEERKRHRQQVATILKINESALPDNIGIKQHKKEFKGNKMKNYNTAEQPAN
jgi:hypothetical protein